MKKIFRGTCGTSAPAHISTGHATIYLTFFLARHLLGEYDLVTMLMLSSNNGLAQLAKVSSLTDALCGIQQDLESLREDVN